jgi:hypothetical protein
VAARVDDKLLRRIEAKLNGHSIFAPSASAMWMGCSGSLIPNLLADDDAGEDAAYGTVGHAVGEEWLLNYGEAKQKFGGPTDMLVDMSEPKHLIGQYRVIKERTEEFHIEIDEEMLEYVRRYVEWCVQDEGEHFVEQRVDFSDLTPIPRQKGTADWAACSWQVLKIKDLKMGRSPDNKVFAKKNSQALLYAYGFFRKWDWLFNFQRIVIGIAQPRLDHFDEWEVSREDLLAFAETVKERAAAAWVLDAPRSPAPYVCKWCRVKATCAALAKWEFDHTDDAFDDLDVIEGEFKVVTNAEMISVKTAIDKGWEPNPKDPWSLSTAQLEHILRYRKLIEKWFSEIEAELEARAENGAELRHFKLSDSRAGRRYFPDQDAAIALMSEHDVPEEEHFVAKLVSPAQAEKLLRTYGGLKQKEAKHLLKSVSIQPPTRRTLAPITDEREALEDSGSVFDDLDEEL